MICDFDCKIFNINRFDLSLDKDDTTYLRERFQGDLEILDRCSIHRLVCFVRHNEERSVQNTLKRAEYFDYFIKGSICSDVFKRFRLRVYPKIFLSKDSPYIKNISRLAVGDSKRIFIDLPLLPQPEYLDETLNKILYNCHLIPVFTNFQNYNFIYSENCIDKLIRIQNASFQFSLSEINRPDNLDLVKRIMNIGNAVLLGTGADHDMLNEKDIIKNLTLLKKKLSLEIYRDILINSSKIFE